MTSPCKLQHPYDATVLTSFSVQCTCMVSQGLEMEDTLFKPAHIALAVYDQAIVTYNGDHGCYAMFCKLWHSNAEVWV